MSEKNKLQRLPFRTIEEAVNGDADALNAVLKHFNRYILELSSKHLRDENGNTYLYIDEYKRRRLETKLIVSIVTKFKPA